MKEDSWKKKERIRKAYYPVRQALGQSSFVGLRPNRWRYAVHWLRLNEVVSLVLSWRSHNMCALPPPPHWHGKSYPQEVQNTFTHFEKRISKGIQPLPSSSGVPTFCEVKATARLTQSSTNFSGLNSTVSLWICMEPFQVLDQSSFLILQFHHMDQDALLKL